MSFIGRWLTCRQGIQIFAVSLEVDLFLAMSTELNELRGGYRSL